MPDKKEKPPQPALPWDRLAEMLEVVGIEIQMLRLAVEDLRKTMQAAGRGDHPEAPQQQSPVADAPAAASAKEWTARTQQSQPVADKPAEQRTLF